VHTEHADELASGKATTAFFSTRAGQRRRFSGVSVMELGEAFGLMSDGRRRR